MKSRDKQFEENQSCRFHNEHEKLCSIIDLAKSFGIKVVGSSVVGTSYLVWNGDTLWLKSETDFASLQKSTSLVDIPFSRLTENIVNYEQGNRVFVQTSIAGLGDPIINFHVYPVDKRICFDQTVSSLSFKHIENLYHRGVLKVTEQQNESAK